MFVPDPNWFGGTVELRPRRQDRRGRRSGTTPSPSPTTSARRLLANYRTAGLADMALAILKAATPAARSSARCTASTS